MLGSRADGRSAAKPSSRPTSIRAPATMRVRAWSARGPFGRHCAQPRRTVRVRALAGFCVFVVLSTASAGQALCSSDSDHPVALSGSDKHAVLNFTRGYSNTTTTCVWEVHCGQGQTAVLEFIAFSSKAKDVLPSFAFEDGRTPSSNDPFAGGTVALYSSGSSPAVRIGPQYNPSFEKIWTTAPQTDQNSSVQYHWTGTIPGGPVGSPRNMTIEVKLKGNQAGVFSASYWCASAPTIRVGCTDSNSPAFDPAAVVSDGSCTSPYVNGRALLAAFAMGPDGRAELDKHPGWDSVSDPCAGWAGTGYPGVSITRVSITGVSTIAETEYWTETILPLYLWEGVNCDLSLLQVISVQWQYADPDPAPSQYSGGGHVTVEHVEVRASNRDAYAGIQAELQARRCRDAGIAACSGEHHGHSGRRLQHQHGMQTSAEWAAWQSRTRYTMFLTRPMAYSLALAIGNLSSLQVLQLNGTGMTGTVPESIGKLRELVTLDISKTGVSGTLPSSLGKPHQLAQLSLSGTEISGTIAAGIWKLPLKTLSVTASDFRGPYRGPYLSGSLPASLSYPLLETLDLHGMGFVGQLPRFTRCDQLKMLKLSNNKFVGGMPNLNSCTRLSVLDVNTNLLTSLPEADSLPPSVSHVYIGANPLNATAAQLSTLTESLPNLHALDLSLISIPILLDKAQCNEYHLNVAPDHGRRLQHSHHPPPPPPQPQPTPQRETEEAAACGGTRVQFPRSCYLGSNAAPCAWLLVLCDSDGQPSITGGLVPNLQLGYICSVDEAGGERSGRVTSDGTRTNAVSQVSPSCSVIRIVTRPVHSSANADGAAAAV